MRPQERNGSPLDMRRKGSFLTNIFKYLFYLNFLLITILQLYLIIRGVLSASQSHRFHPKEWYIPVLSATACSGIIGLSLQVFTWFHPWRALKATFYLSPLFTCAYGVLLVCIGTPGSSAAAVFALVSSVVQSLYACWVSPRFHHASRILTVSIAQNPPKLKTIIPLSISICTLYSAFLMSGIGGATATKTKLNLLFIFLSIGSFTWTPLPLLGAMLEKFSATVEPAVWWPEQRRRQSPKEREG